MAAGPPGWARPPALHAWVIIGAALWPLFPGVGVSLGNKPLGLQLGARRSRSPGYKTQCRVCIWWGAVGDRGRWCGVGMHGGGGSEGWGVLINNKTGVGGPAGVWGPPGLAVGGPTPGGLQGL